jgi:hypothetical protein
MNEMPYDELIKWTTFFSKRPVGWREDYRTYLIMSSFGVKEPPEKIFYTLEQIRKESEKEKLAKLPTGEWLERMINSKDGDHEWKPFWDNENDKTSNQS